MMLSVVNWWAVCRRMVFLIFEWLRGSVMPRGLFPVDPAPGLILCPFQKFAFIPFCELSHISGLFLFCHSKTFVHIVERSSEIRLDIPRKSFGGAVICCDLLRCPVLLLVGYWYRCRFNHAISSFCNKYFIRISSTGILQ